MDLKSIFGIVTSVMQEFPKFKTVFSDLTGVFKGTAPVNHPNTGGPQNSQPNETMKSIQHLLNQYVKPTPPLVEDGLFGAKTEAAMKQGLSLFGLKL